MDGWTSFDAARADWLLGLLSDHQLTGAAAAAVAAGCESPSLGVLARLRDPDQSTALELVFGACTEHGMEFPLRDDAIKCSVDHLLACLVAGSISPEEASVRLWSLADLDHDAWRAEMLALASDVLDRGGIAAANYLGPEDASCDLRPAPLRTPRAGAAESPAPTAPRSARERWS